MGRQRIVWDGDGLTALEDLWHADGRALRTGSNYRAAVSAAARKCRDAYLAGGHRVGFERWEPVEGHLRGRDGRLPWRDFLRWLRSPAALGGDFSVFGVRCLVPALLALGGEAEAVAKVVRREAKRERLLRRVARLEAEE